MKDDLIRRSDVRRLLEDEKRCGYLDAGDILGIPPVILDDKKVIPEPEDDDCRMFVEYRNGQPVGYRYGPPWVGMQLYLEGGYKTPEEARKAWEEGK